MDFGKFFEFILDSNHKLSKRVAIVLAGLMLLIFLDRMFKFSDNYITTKKLEQVEKIEKLLESDKTDSLTKVRLRAIEITVLERQTAWNYLSDLYLFTKNLIKRDKNPTLNTNIAQENITKNNIPNSSSITRSVLWHTISSSWILILLMFFFPFIPFIQYNKIQATDILVLIVLEIFLMILVFLFSTVFALIPTFDNPFWNYVINFILHFFFISIVSAGIIKQQKNAN